MVIYWAIDESIYVDVAFVTGSEAVEAIFERTSMNDNLIFIVIALMRALIINMSRFCYGEIVKTKL